MFAKNGRFAKRISELLKECPSRLQRMAWVCALEHSPSLVYTLFSSAFTRAHTGMPLASPERIHIPAKYSKCTWATLPFFIHHFAGEYVLWRWVFLLVWLKRNASNRKKWSLLMDVLKLALTIHFYAWKLGTRRQLQTCSHNNTNRQFQTQYVQVIAQTVDNRRHDDARSNRERIETSKTDVATHIPVLGPICQSSHANVLERYIKMYS